MNPAEDHHNRLKALLVAKGKTPSGNYALDYIDVTRAINDEFAEVEVEMLTIVSSTLKASLSREKALRDALMVIQAWDIAVLQVQAMSKTDKADMELQGDYEHDARYAYPLQEKAIRTIARAALASTETEK